MLQILVTVSNEGRLGIQHNLKDPVVALGWLNLAKAQLERMLLGAEQPQSESRPPILVAQQIPNFAAGR